MTFENVQLDNLKMVAQEIINLVGNNRTLAFFGEMGVGKTTLILKIIEALGSVDVGGSPTFSLVNEYLTVQGATIYHFDFYRVESEEQILDIGYEEYFFGDSYCLVEWPEKMGSLLPEDAVKVYLTQNNDVRRIVLDIPS